MSVIKPSHAKQVNRARGGRKRQLGGSGRWLRLKLAPRAVIPVRSNARS